MAKNDLKTRTMLKTVERVDIGVFGGPLKALAWSRKRRSTWGGWAGMAAAQAVMGVVFALLAGLALGVPLNALSMAVIVGFAAGSVIGGPFSFLLWTVLLLSVTSLIGGVTMGVWAASPSWWRTLADEWAQGNPVPGWFMIAVPAWMLFWVAASRGVSKVSEMLFEKLALRLGFRKAVLYTEEDKRVYDEAYDMSDVSRAETRSLMENGGDGSHALIAVEPSRMAGRVVQSSPEMGGDPDDAPDALPRSSDSLDYDDLLGGAGDDPDVIRAIGTRPAQGLEPVGTAGAEPDSPSESGSDAAEGVVIEMGPLGLPDVPRDTSPPIRRVAPPPLDPKANRSLHRRMQQFKLAFETARREDRDVEFVEKHHDEMRRMSDEQRAVLESMDGTAPLLELIRQVQRNGAEAFLAGRGDLDVDEGVGSLDAAPGGEAEPAGPQAMEADAQAAPADVGITPGAVPVASHDEGGATPDDLPFDVSSTVPSAAPVKADIAAMAASLSNALSERRRSRPPAPAEDVASETTVQETDDVSGDPLSPETGGATEQPSPSDPDAGVDSGTDETTAPPTTEPASAPEDVPEPPREILGFEVDLVPTSNDEHGEPGSEAPASDADDENPRKEPEEEMSSRAFSRIVCRQVCGLITGSASPSEKAEDVMAFEKSEEMSVAEIINSRSFDELVSETDAAAARHSWREVRAFLSQTSADRLIGDFDRVNQRGRALIEQPHTLTTAALHSFENESLRLRKATSADGPTLQMAINHVSDNYAILETLTAMMEAREEAARSGRSGTVPTAASGDRPRGEDRDQLAVRGGGLIGSVLKGARRTGKALPAGAKATTKASTAKDASLEASAAGGDVLLADAVEASRPGDEGFVSAHPSGSAKHAEETGAHDFILGHRRDRVQEETRVADDERMRADGERDRDLAERRRRDEQDAEDRRQRTDEERRADDDRRQREDDESKELARIARDAAEAERRAKEADAERAAIALAREREEAQRSQEEHAAFKQFRERKGEFEIPERFRSEEISRLMMSLAEMRSVRLVLQGSIVGSRPAGMSDDEAALRIPSVRGVLQMDVEAQRVATQALVLVASCVDAAKPDEVGEVEKLLTAEELPFFNRIRSPIERGQAAAATLDRADKLDAETRRRADVADDAERLRASLDARTIEVDGARQEADRLRLEAEAAGTRAAEAEAERQRASDELAALKKQMAGVVDDDFQKFLDESGTRMENADLEGFYAFKSSDEASLVIVMTTPAAAFPDGVVQRGNRSIGASDMIEFTVNKARSVFTDNVALLYVDSLMRAHVVGLEGMGVKQVRRTAAELVDMLRNYGIVIEGN